MIAIGRGEGLYSAIEHLHAAGVTVTMIISSKEYSEYQRSLSDYSELAKRIGAQFISTTQLDDSVVTELRNHIAKNNTKLAISANWRFRIPAEIISLFELGILNCHMGQLPDYKGNAAANWMILNGQTFMYVDVHKMDDSLDCGDIISRKEVAISDDTYIGDLWNACNDAMPGLFLDAAKLLRTDPNYFLKKNSPNGLRCYPRMEQDHQIDWHRDAVAVSRLVRASSRPLSGAYTFFEGKKVVIWRARPVSLPHPFMAVPGHILDSNKDSGKAIIACKETALELEEIEINQENIRPSDFFRSIRKRCESGH